MFKWIKESLFGDWKENPKRFSYKILDKPDLYSGGRSVEFITGISIKDKISKETFVLTVALRNAALKHHKLRNDPIYPCLDMLIFNFPSWMTREEGEYLENSILPYYKKRCERYIELIEYRKDRQRNHQNKLAQLTKQKERDRLMELYK